jgi:hypothetical protein
MPDVVNNQSQLIQRRGGRFEWKEWLNLFTQIIATAILTSIGFFIGIFSIILEKPPVFAKTFTLVVIAIINGFWYAIHCADCIKKRKWRSLKFSLAVYFAFLLPFIFIILFPFRFNSIQWKSDMQGFPNARGYMVEDIISSRLLIGKSESDVLQILGKPDHQVFGEYEYYYSDSFFDGCDNMRVIFKNGLCTAVITYD